MTNFLDEQTYLEASIGSRGKEFRAQSEHRAMNSEVLSTADKH